jgi:hypothetical protein
MKVFSNSSRTLSDTLSRIAASTGSADVNSGAPARLSSQFALHRIFMSSPLISDFGRATGVCSCNGAFVSVS